MSVRQTMLENGKFSSGITQPSRFRHIALAVLLALAVPFAPAQATTVGQDPNAVVPRQSEAPIGETEQKILLTEIENYFDGVDTLKARFMQFNMDGTLFRGDVMMDRPGKMRIDYDDPLPFKIISDGNFYIFIDEELKESSYIPLGLTPANMLLRKPMKLSGELTVLDATRDQEALFITVVQSDAPDQGSLTFAFSEEPIELLQWTVIDAQGTVTRVVLQNVETGIELDDDLFYFADPWIGRENKK